jgi:hypothetical protein
VRGPILYAVLAASASLAAFQVHGSNLSSSWFFVRPETTRSSTSVNHANGSTSFNFADTINVATINQRWPPLSLPANKAFFLVSTIGRMARSTVFVSSSRRPSSKKQDQPSPVIERIAHGLCQSGTPGDAVDLYGEPQVHRLDNRATALLTCQPAIFGGLAADFGFNRIERGDTQQGFLDQRRLRGDLDLVELSPRVGPAEGQLDAGVRGVPDQAAKPRVTIDLEQTAEAFHVRCRVLTLADFAVNLF